MDYKIRLAAWLLILWTGYNPVDLSPLIGYHPNIVSLTYGDAGSVDIRSLNIV